MQICEVISEVRVNVRQQPWIPVIAMVTKQAGKAVTSGCVYTQLYTDNSLSKQHTLFLFYTSLNHGLFMRNYAYM